MLSSATMSVSSTITLRNCTSDSACSFVVDLEGDGAHYALPRDIALANADKEERRENPDQLLAVGARGLTQLCPLRLAGSSAKVRRVRVLMRARFGGATSWRWVAGRRWLRGGGRAVSPRTLAACTGGAPRGG